MIPKIIHYCWFGGGPLPKEYIKYMETWKKFCPDFEIKKWDESNYDVSKNNYMKEAYDAKQWAFVSDFARLDIIYNYGGVYLDTDIELLQDLAPLIENGDGFIGFQNPLEVNSGLGFAAAPYNICVKEMLEVYKYRKFINEDGSFNKVPCPASNTVGLLNIGLNIPATPKTLIQRLPGLNVYAQEFFNPLDADTGKLRVTKNTYMIHHYSASWYSDYHKFRKKIKKLIPSYFLKKRTLRIAQNDIERVKQEIVSLKGNL